MANILLRIDNEEKKGIETLAKRNRRSLNNEILMAISNHTNVEIYVNEHKKLLEEIYALQTELGNINIRVCNNCDKEIIDHTIRYYDNKHRRVCKECHYFGKEVIKWK